ncbi:hypothetical protein K7711_24650 [Nocardia sp. CA2R105]|uniref:hypothetical protein n=1 Tax=Nocardia coffeae TaxID=2873381 RepID=UPI001CA761A9|nr:hypothetical protein [Nocardia coffeae]MBY8859679.1 hypothetical protein [Nocardia coffeae]
MNPMSAWDELSSIVTVLTGCAVVLLALGCLWPNPRPTPQPRDSRQPHCSTVPSCSPPPKPFTLATAHRDMQLHRDHTCARKRAAFAALVAAGHITPDSYRPWHRP